MDVEAKAAAARDDILIRFYNGMGDPDEVYGNELCDAHDLTRDEFIYHVLEPMRAEFLLDGHGVIGWGDQGPALYLTGHGILEAERSGRTDRGRTERFIVARVATLRFLDEFRKTQGLRGVCDFERDVTEQSGIPVDLIHWAVVTLDAGGYIERHRIHGHNITGEGREWLALWNEYSQLQTRLDELQTLSPRKRGKGLEAVLASAIRSQGWRCREDTGGIGEQIDLHISGGGLYLIAECKWEKDPIEGGVISEMAGRLQPRPPFVIGIVLSVSGFTKGAVVKAELAAGHHAILLIGEDDIRGIILGSRALEDVIEEQLASIIGEGKLLRSGASPDL